MFKSQESDIASSGSNTGGNPGGKMMKKCPEFEFGVIYNLKKLSFILIFNAVSCIDIVNSGMLTVNS
jgi:hypothetical protein